MNFESINVLTAEQINAEYENVLDGVGNIIEGTENLLAEYNAPGGACTPCIKNGRSDYSCSWYYNFSYVYVCCNLFGCGTTTAGDCYYGMCKAVGAIH